MADKHVVRFEPVGLEIEVDEQQTILRAAFEQGVMLMHGCKEGQCSACKSFVLDGDDIELTELTTECGTVGPLHIINCALNLGGSSDLALHTRHSASFTLSPLHCGSCYKSREQSGIARELGYVVTNRYGGQFGTPTLGQAISVSGAAASPNMGYHTSPVVSFLLTVFNVRLGWWLRNPRVLDEGGSSLGTTHLYPPPSPPFSLLSLVRKLLGRPALTSVRSHTFSVLLRSAGCDREQRVDGYEEQAAKIRGKRKQ